MIKLSNIAFQYPQSDFKLSIDDLEIEEGKKTAIIGPSGFGKTTLLNLLAGIFQPDQGEIIFHNKALNALNDKQRRNFRSSTIGFVFQDFRLIPYLNVVDNILLPYRINETLKISSECTGLAHDLAEKLGISDKMRKYPDKLSQGERQRVAICRALIHQPKVILADEPTGNLDPENKRKIMINLFDYVNGRGATLVTVTHDYDMLEGFDKIIDFINFRASTP